MSEGTEEVLLPLWPPSHTSLYLRTQHFFILRFTILDLPFPPCNSENACMEINRSYWIGFQHFLSGFHNIRGDSADDDFCSWEATHFHGTIMEYGMYILFDVVVLRKVSLCINSCSYWTLFGIDWSTGGPQLAIQYVSAKKIGSLMDHVLIGHFSPDGTFLILEMHNSTNT